MYITQFTGNQNVKKLLASAINSNNLVHGILLCADDGLGANYFARLLAADILGVKDLAAVMENQHPSLQVIQGEGAQNIIKVEKIRRINDNVNFSSMDGEKRVIIIENCENFNLNSANALLKNLEEPKDDITYILTTSNAEKILATIRSRCGVYTLTQPTKDEVLEYFRGEKADIAAVEKLEKIYGENIGKIKSALNDKKRADILACALKVRAASDKKDAYTVAKEMYVYNKDRDSLKTLLADIQSICSAKMNERNVQVLSLIEKYTEILSYNTNLNLVIESFAMERCR